MTATGTATGGARRTPATTWVVSLGLASLTLAALILAVTAGPASAARKLSGTFAIAAGAAYATSPEVTLDSSFRGATQMRFRNADGVYSAWEPYQPSRAWTLDPGDGTKSVEAQYRGAGGARVTVVDQIVLDGTAPLTTAVYDVLEGRVVSLSLEPADALSGVVGTWFRVDAGPWQDGTRVVLQVQRKRAGGLPAGPHSVDFFSADGAGNVEAVRTVIVTLTL